MMSWLVLTRYESSMLEKFRITIGARRLFSGPGSLWVVASVNSLHLISVKVTIAWNLYTTSSVILDNIFILVALGGRAPTAWNHADNVQLNKQKIRYWVKSVTIKFALNYLRRHKFQRQSWNVTHQWCSLPRQGFLLQSRGCPLRWTSSFQSRTRYLRLRGHHKGIRTALSRTCRG